MSTLNPLFAILIYVLAFATAYLIHLKFKIVNNSARFESLDGLRGFLALGVFIHHSTVWFQYLQSSKWKVPNSNFYTHLGHTSVSLFFMITAFLFISKILNSANKINWTALFISRFFRLVPLYLFSILLVVIFIFTIDDWQLKDTTVKLTKSLFCWATFTIPACYSINSSPYTGILNAGVVWSLPYEWLFYFSLPILSVLISRKHTSLLYIIISLVFIAFFYNRHAVLMQHLLSFAGGAIAPFIIKYGSKKTNYNSFYFSLLVLVLVASLLFFKTTDNYVCKLLIAIIFNLIALGNSIFGILKNSILKFLGEISYSTYLLHGLLISIVMFFGFGITNASKLSESNFCIILFALTPILVIISFLTYSFIEKPSMNYSKKLIANFF